MTEPAVGRSTPATVSTRVDFPAPFGPSSAVISPGGIRSDTSWRTGSPPRETESPSNDSVAESTAAAGALMPAPAPAKPAPPLLGRLRQAYGSCRPLAPTAGHRDPQLLLCRVRRVLADDLPLLDDAASVGQRENLFELERDEQPTYARAAVLD